jgi:hypothetical protein
LGLIAAFLFGYGPIVINSWVPVLSIFADIPFVSQGVAEIERAVGDNPGLKVAVGPAPRLLTRKGCA